MEMDEKMEYMKLVLEKYSFIMHEFQFNQSKTTLIPMVKEFVDKYGNLGRGHHLEYTTSLGDKIIFDNDNNEMCDEWIINDIKVINKHI